MLWLAGSNRVQGVGSMGCGLCGSSRRQQHPAPGRRCCPTLELLPPAGETAEDQGCVLLCLSSRDDSRFMLPMVAVLAAVNILPASRSSLCSGAAAASSLAVLAVQLRTPSIFNLIMPQFSAG